MTYDSFSTQSFEGSDVELLELYLAGKLTGSAAERVERWMAAHKDAHEVVEIFRGGVVGVDTRAPDAWEIVEWVRARRSWHDRRKASVSWAGHATWKLGTQPLRQKTWYVIAGVTACLLTLVLTRYDSIPLSGHASEAVSVYTTGDGERANITLPDGNTIILNVASRLQVAADYLAGNHTLHLSGEALFSVTHHASAPFTVIAGADTTRVLGTTFLVRHYASDRATSVAVREGRVMVRASAAKQTIVTAGQELVVNPMGSVRLGDADPGEFSFARGVLTVAGGLFPDAIPELDRWYNADIRLGDSALVTHRLTGAFPAGSLSDLTGLLEGTYDVRIVRTRRILTLYRN